MSLGHPMREGGTVGNAQLGLGNKTKGVGVGKRRTAIIKKRTVNQIQHVALCEGIGKSTDQ